jgi:hypothetical protein
VSYLTSRSVLAALIFLCPLVAGAEAGELFGTSSAISDTSLGEIAGGADIGQYIFSSNTSTVANNSVNGTSVTGTISIDGQAFQNLNGLAVVNANTGNNVSINASMNVNVSTHP